MNYARIQRHANTLVERHGKPAILIRLEQSGPAYNPTITEVQFPVRLVETGNDLSNRAGSLVQMGDRLGIVSTTGEAPRLADKIVIDGSRYSFVDLQSISPGAATLAYTFVARK